MKIINDALLQEKIKWKPHKAQQEILKCKARDITICAGTRFGKSMLCGYFAFKRLMADNQRIWIVSLNYDMAKKIFNYVIDFAAAFDKRLLKGVQNRPFPRFEIKEFNSWIECKSVENETSLMGEELDLAILDEASRMKPDIYQRYIKARLASRMGKSFVIGTPFGKNWFHNRYLNTKKTNSSFHFTSKDNPLFPISEWEENKKSLPNDIFKQEYEAKFLDDAASVFRGIKEIINDNCYEKPKQHRYLLGVDLAKHEDFTVLTVLDKYSHKVVYWDRFNKIGYPLQKERIKSIAKRYNNARIWIDSTGLGEPIYDDLRAQGLLIDDFKISGGKGGSKEKLIDKLSIYIEQKAIFIPNEPVMIDELESYGYQMTKNGNITYSAPQGMHDDCVISLALAVWGLMSTKTKNPNKMYQQRSSHIKKFEYV